MSDTLLKQLLEEADRALDEPAIRPDLPDRVRAMRRVRRRRSIAAMSILGVLLLTGAVVLTAREAGPHTDTRPVAFSADEDIEQMRRQFERVRVQTEARLAAIDRALLELRLRQQIQLLEAELLRSPRDSVDEQIERAAFIMVYQADRMHDELGLQASAIESYQRAVKLFPNTNAAEHARRRLKQIDQQGEVL